jgi:repressor LexA
MVKNLTRRQKEVLKHIEDFVNENSIPPSVRDIAAAHQCSVKGAYDHIRALEKKGYIDRSERRSRSIVLTETALQVLKPQESKRIPLLGRIAAGSPILAEQNVEELVDFPLDKWERSKYFALKIVGDSMRDAGIHDGDIGIFRFQQTAEPGKIVVALVGEEATVKYYYNDGRRVILRAANPAYPDQIRPDVQIQGILRGLIRTKIEH